MSSPAPHQDSPKVPLLVGRGQIEALAKARYERTRRVVGEQWDDLDPNGSIRPGMCHEVLDSIEEAAPLLFSALLSDEVVAAAVNAIGGRLGDINREVRDALEAAIEQVGGGQGGG